MVVIKTNAMTCEVIRLCFAVSTAFVVRNSLMMQHILRIELANRLNGVVSRAVYNKCDVIRKNFCRSVNKWCGF